MSILQNWIIIGIEVIQSPFKNKTPEEVEADGFVWARPLPRLPHLHVQGIATGSATNLQVRSISINPHFALIMLQVRRSVLGRSSYFDLGR